MDDHTEGEIRGCIGWPWRYHKNHGTKDEGVLKWTLGDYVLTYLSLYEIYYVHYGAIEVFRTTYPAKISRFMEDYDTHGLTKLGVNEEQDNE